VIGRGRRAHVVVIGRTAVEYSQVAELRQVFAYRVGELEAALLQRAS
jgi:hypothetical protein